MISRAPRCGASRASMPTDQCVVSPAPRLGSCATLTTATIGPDNWEVYDFGDTIPAVKGDPINDAYEKTTTDKNKCLLLHLAEAALCVTGPTGVPRSYSDLKLPKSSNWRVFFGWNNINRRWPAPQN